MTIFFIENKLLSVDVFCTFILKIETKEYNRLFNHETSQHYVLHTHTITFVHVLNRNNKYFSKFSYIYVQTIQN